ncbi:hypothetical protein B0919_08310 [Hymenobacter sp. CRA2]|nr:hypothetical protein B0919_08310 [Hymenobacter sp. CRA2]
MDVSSLRAAQKYVCIVKTDEYVCEKFQEWYSLSLSTTPMNGEDSNDTNWLHECRTRYMY